MPVGGGTAVARTEATFGGMLPMAVIRLLKLPLMLEAMPSLFMGWGGLAFCGFLLFYFYFGLFIGFFIRNAWMTTMSMMIVGYIQIISNIALLLDSLVCYDEGGEGQHGEEFELHGYLAVLIDELRRKVK